MATLEHETLLVRRGTRSGCFCFVAVHSTARGPSLGGCRMWHYDDSRAAMRDALRLSRAMTYKSAVAGLPLGGGKGVIMLPAQIDPRLRRAALRDFGDTVDQLGGAYITAEDVGTSAKDMEAIAERTKYVTGLSRRRGGSGDPSPWTALGVEASIRASPERKLGSSDPKGRTIVVNGLGHVGFALTKLLAKAGAKLVVSDIDRAKKAFADQLGARWVAPGKTLTMPADVLAPCALGGILDHESVPKLQVPIVAGAANNQLADDPIADLLADRGILWAPDFVANAGGIINISVELERGGYDPDRARAKVNGIGDTLRHIYDLAQSDSDTPFSAALGLAARRVAEAG
jgi:leucine dehydrogenase